MAFVRLQWDNGNWPKCGKHGVSKDEIEEIFRNEPHTSLDPFKREERFRASGLTSEGRHVFVVFTIRDHNGADMIRPIGARYMHAREIKKYDQS